mmetsp:Transcript_17412/g.34207  ORF Transcript_17412/g.34207 Transcript_17412/m.34207 type:complete len:185 (-) Transcript_17412:351-905(-)|eukprot:CAMPEP_0171530076 /NCGR_PEP_ID=MMETSP0959-20130129/12807_1 /TAXON_ID=87120 /ORGANISM="Aurantiochytrium limacinum, Strain ATCCMYA-1381" /LENGTH=184 /DNA_ID=CAMNT_0012072689 /DNA_START=993 /DNA_END=1547 /DNA_ORIENTATION=+
MSLPSSSTSLVTSKTQDARIGSQEIQVVVDAADVGRLRGLRIKNHFCSMVTISRRGDRENYKQVVQLGDAPHTIDRAQDWFSVELDQMLLFEDGRNATFVLQGAQASPMWMHVNAQILHGEAEFHVSRTAQASSKKAPANNLQRNDTNDGAAYPLLQEAVTQFTKQMATLQALNRAKARLGHLG